LLELEVKDGSTLILGEDPSGLWLVHEVPDVSPQPRAHPVAGHLRSVQPVWIGMTDRPDGGGVYVVFAPQEVDRSVDRVQLKLSLTPPFTDPDPRREPDEQTCELFTCGARRVWMSKPEPFTPWMTVKAQWLSDEHLLREEETEVEPARLDHLRSRKRTRLNLARSRVGLAPAQEVAEARMSARAQLDAVRTAAIAHPG